MLRKFKSFILLNLFVFSFILGCSKDDEKVKSPVFTPKGGVYTTLQSITISTETEGAEIYFTINGDNPTKDSTKYENEITISESTAIKAKAFKKDYDDSDITTEVYELNIPKKTKIKIVHTNDIHGRIEKDTYGGMGFARIYSKVKELRDNGENVLLLDAGDTIHGQVISNLDKGESVIELMNMMGYDAMTTGNHDFNYGQERLLELKEKASFPIMAANITKEDGTSLLDKYIIKDIEGVKIAIIGISTPETLYKTNPKNIEKLNFESPYETAQSLVDELKNTVDIIVALTHLGLEGEYTSEKLAEQVEGIDLIVDGHSHDVLQEGKEVNNTLIVMAGEYGKYLGITEIEYNSDKTKIVKSNLLSKEEAEAILIEDEGILNKINEIKSEQEQITSEVVGYTDIYLDGVRDNVRTGQTNLENLIAEAMLSISNADCSLTNGGGIRASIEIGDITKGEIISVLPFGNYVTTIKITGEEIKKALENGVSDYPKSKGAFPHIAGMSFKIDTSKSAGERVIDLKINGENVDNLKEYKLATNDFLAAGGDGYNFADKTIIAEYEALEEVLIAYISEKGLEKAVIDNRIEVIEGINFEKITILNLNFENVIKENIESILIHPNAASDEACYEPEYIALSSDSKKAWVSLQENNAIAVIDLENQIVEKIVGLGFKNHGLEGNGLDASDKDKEINIRTYQNLYGIYQPDSIVSYNIGGQDYIFTANEGDDLWVGDTPDELRAKKITIDENVENKEEFADDTKAGRLNVYKYLGDENNDGKYEKLYAFGTRSFSIWNKDINQMYDSGYDIEKKVSQSEYVKNDYNKFNLDNNDEENSAEKESDNSGPSPEGIDVGKVGDKIFAFVGLEKIGGVIIYDITDVNNVKYINYVNTRSLNASKEDMLNNNAGDLGPEGIKFISKEKSPIDKALLLVANEISGTVNIFEVEENGSLILTARYVSGAGFDEGGAEIVNYDYETKKMLVVNGKDKSLDILDLSNLKEGSIDEYKKEDAKQIKVSEIAIENFTAKDVTSVSVYPKGKIAAISVPAVDSHINKGQVIFIDLENESFLKNIEVGYLPDMLIFTEDGKRLLVANEGEPEYKEYEGKEVSGYYNVTPVNDPEGSVSIINLN